MKIFNYKNSIPLFIYLSLIYSNSIPTADAGDDISVLVTSCQNKSITILVDGSSSSNPGVGLCDTGVCSDSDKYCTTSEGGTSEICATIEDCTAIKVCVGGENDNLECSSDSSICGVGSCEFPGECLSEYSFKEHCEAAGEEWTSNYQFSDESSCEDLYGVSNNKWYDYTLDFYWSSDNENITISNTTSSFVDIIFAPLSSIEPQEYKLYLTVNNQFSSSDSDELSITLDPQLPCAIAGEDMYMCRSCGDINSLLHNEAYIDTVLSNIQLDASLSSSSTSASLSYLWNAPAGFTLSDVNISNPTVSIDYDIAKNAVNMFILEVVDNSNTNLVSVLDTVILYMNPSRPLPPKVEVYPENDKITLNWEKNSSFESIDSLTGYMDFEGYRVYKSIDGGETWGSADDRIYYNGEHVGWRYKDQTDLLETRDYYFCTKGVNTGLIGEDSQYKSWEECVDGEESNEESCCVNNLIRGASVANLDPYAPWVNLGDPEGDSEVGLKFSYIDTSVYNGKEYTYAVVAYDIGLQTYTNEASSTGEGICEPCDSSDSETTNTEEVCCIQNDGAWFEGEGVCNNSCSGDGHTWTATYEYIQTWSSTNPDQFTYDGINGFQSLESDLIDSVNVVTAIPAFYADNVDNISGFIDKTDYGVPAEDKFMERYDNTVGNGGLYFQIINPYDITDTKYKFEINADYAGSDVQIFEGYKTEFPKLYAWAVDDDSEPLDYEFEITSVDQLTHDRKCELLNLPGSYIQGQCSRETWICEGGNRDGRECTYDEDFCIGGECIESPINYLDNYYSCICDDILADLSGADNTATFYNDWLDDGDTVFYPIYDIEDFTIKYLYQDGFEENYTDFLDGLKLLFNNNIQNLEDSGGKVVVNKLESYDKDNKKTSLSDYINITLEYGSGGSVFDNKPSYGYRIELSDEPTYESNTTVPASACSGNQPNTLLPFKVINTTTEKPVGITHVDLGGFYDESGEYNAYGTCIEDGNPCTQSQYCNINECVDLVGYGDCAWEKNERTSFTQDTIHVGLTTKETPAYTFDLKIDYRVYSLYSKGIDPSEVNLWSLGTDYNTGNVVKYNDMFWEAQGDPGINVSPVDWVEDSDNPWSPIYPWNDGDYIIIEPTRWYVDGDAWIADLSKLGENTDITSEDLKKISVVPNPYIVHSDYDETSTSKRLWFNHLPNRCRITIYTISGERVVSILHDEDDLSGKESWDLRSEHGELVAPGLYIYTVESENGNKEYIKHISKFAIIR